MLNEPILNTTVPNSTNRPNPHDLSECSRTIPCKHGFEDGQKRLFSENPESYGDRESPLLLKVDELLLFFSALNEIDDFTDTESRCLENIKQAFHAGHRQFLRLFAVLDASTLVRILECDGFLPLGVILTFLLDKGALVLEAIKVDFTIHQAIGGLLLNAESRKRRCQIQDRIKAIRVDHVNHTQSIGLQPVGGIVCQDLGIRETLDNLVQHEDVAKGLRTKDRSLANVPLGKLGSRTVHAGPIQHGFGVIHADLGNVGFPEPARIGCRTTPGIQEFEFIFVPSIHRNLTNGGSDLTHHIGRVKQRILKGRLELVPRIFDEDTLAFLVFKAFDNSLHRDTLQDDA